MSEQRFDLTYRGLIAAGADPEETRRRLTEIFKLTDKGAERLFAGRPVVVKRDVDAATAARFEKFFAQSGAVLTVTPVEGPDTPSASDPAFAGEGPRTPQVIGIDPGRLALAPDFGDLESPPVVAPPPLDLSYLSLVPGDDWTLEDCEPPPTPIPELDLSRLSLVPLEPRAEPGADQRWD